MNINDWLAVDVSVEGKCDEEKDDIGLWMDLDPEVWPWRFITREEANRLIVALGGTPPTEEKR